MEGKVHGHFVVENQQSNRTIVAVLFFQSAHLTVPVCYVRAKERLKDEGVDSLTFIGSCWIFRSAEVFVMTLGVLIYEVRVHKFRIGPSSGNFVDHFTLMEQFVATNSIQASEKAPEKGENIKLGVTSRFQVENEPIRLDVVAKQH